LNLRRNRATALPANWQVSATPVWSHTCQFTGLEWAGTPEHQLVGPLTESLATLDPDTRAEVAALHRSMMGVVARVVAETGVADDEVAGVVDLLAGVVLGAARAEGAAGPDEALRTRLDAAVEAILVPGAPPVTARADGGESSTRRRRSQKQR
jgi:hypothetical protein